MAINYQPVAHSTFLDYAGHRITNAPTVESAYHITDGKSSPYGINVALVLPRVTDASGLLAQDWGTRQHTIEDLNKAGELWTTYGASKTQYDSLVSTIESAPFNLQVLHDSKAEGNYVSSAESRTIWVNIATAADFKALLNTELMYSESKDLIYWNGDLSLPSGWDVTGLWVDYSTSPPATNLSSGTPVTLTAGPQSVGTSAPSSGDLPPGVPQLSPDKIAGLYNFPLDGQTVQTGYIGLIERGTGDVLPEGSQPFDQLLKEYLAGIDRSGSGKVEVQGKDGQSYEDGDPGERSLDVGVVAAVNPNSHIKLYVGSGYNGDAGASVFTAIQSAIWDTTMAVGNTTTKAAVTSTSFHDSQNSAPDSPFYRAYRELFVDAALANQTTFIALGDGGSGGQTGNGLTNIRYMHTQPWNVLVGGTSLSTTNVADADQTLAPIVELAKDGNPATIWQLVAGGLTTLPDDAASTQAFVETVWNTYFVVDEGGRHAIEGIPHSGFHGGYTTNMATAGGVDVTQSVPSYQVDFGLNPTTPDPLHRVGRGAPDVAANAGGNLIYTAPPADMVDTTGWAGTSAASPLWASLAIQINTIFQDQNLPNLGYMNDLLYTAAAIAPAAFNDITMGNNTSSFFEPGEYQSSTGSDPDATVPVSPTGYGYAAGWGYDLTTGLGTPNGVLLARALTAIAHSEMSYDETVPHVLNSYGAGGWTSGTEQSLLIQIVSPDADVDVKAGSSRLDLSSGATGEFAWTAQFAGHAGQKDFDADLVRLFDRFGQGAVGQVTVDQGDPFAVAIDGIDAQAFRAPLTNQFGFVDFQAAGGMVRVARPVAVAETVGAADDQTAVVNIRQNGSDSLKLGFFRVDDFTGSIGGLAPGAAGYEAAAQARAYHTASGAMAIDGPGYGKFTQAKLQDIDSGDIVAMKLVDTTQGKTYWAFAQANEVVDGQHVGHIWNYGLNTWGFEDTFGGGDGDYNDLVVNLDFTSAFGHGWLV